jgi:hypothetical protein
MRKKFFWAVTALAMLPGVVQKVNAQATGAADVAADASVAADDQSVSEAATGSADAATDSVSEAATGQTEASPTPATPSPQPSPDAAATASAEAVTNTEGTSSAGTEQPQADAAANADINANADSARAQDQANFEAPANPASINAGLQFGSATDRGVTLNRVANDSFLYRSGLRQGDVLISYGGQPIRSQADFNRWAVYQPGQRVPLVVWRDGREETVFVTYDQQPMQRQAGYAPQSGGAYLGVTFDPQSNRGAVVRSVAPGSPAENAGIAPGQIIVAINDRRVSNYQDVISYVATLQPGQEVDLIVAHRVTLSARTGQANYPAPPSGVAVESSVVRQAPVVPSPAGVVPATRIEDGPAVARPGDADRDGRVLDGDGRIGPRERAGRR